MSQRPNQLGQGQRHAVIIACNHPPQADQAPLDAPEREAQALGNLLSTPDICDFVVKCFLGADSSSEAVQGYLTTLLPTLGPEDSLVVVWSGHGLPWNDDLVLMTVDAVRHTRAGGLSCRWLHEEILLHPRLGHAVLILNCCYSGLGIGSSDFSKQLAKPFAYDRQTTKEIASRVIIAAAHAHEAAMEAQEQSALLSRVLSGLQGEATAQGLGKVTIDSLWNYIQTTSTTLAQTPIRHSWSSIGGLVLAWHPRLAPSTIGDLENLIAQQPPSISTPGDKQQLFSNEWFKKHLLEVVKTAEPRYTPELTVTVPIYKEFEAFGRTLQWKKAIIEQSKSISKILGRWSRSVSSSNDPLVPPLPISAQEPTKILLPLIQRIIQLLEELFASNDNTILNNLQAIIRSAKEQASLCLSITTKSLEDEHGEGKADSAPFRQFMAEYQVSFPTAHVDLSRATVEQLSILEKWLVIYGSLSLSSSAMVIGPAGIGKTHSICDIALDRFGRGLYSLVLFGQHFTEGEPWEQIRQLLGLSSTLSRDEILKALNTVGEETGYPCILFIDALNETQPRVLWRNHLSRFIGQISQYPWLKICFSCRSTYVEDTLPTDIPITKIEHKGFEGIEFDACFEFFKYYNIEPPSTPLLQAEFSNPLFLRLVCESLKDSIGFDSIDNIFNLTDVISSLLDSKEHKIAEVLDYNPRESIIKDTLQLLLNRMKDSQSRWLDWKDTKNLCNSIWPSQQRATSLFDQLLREGLLKEDRVVDSKSGSIKDVVRFSFERLGDYLLAEECLRNLDTSAVKAAFVENGNLYFSVKSKEEIEANLGLLEALAICLPEKYGLELTEVVDDTNSPRLTLTVIESIRWRNPSSITLLTECIVLNALRKKETFNETMDVVLSMGARVGHRLNALWFHDLAMSSPMPKRDSWLCPYLHVHYEDRTTINRLIHWGLRVEAHTISNEIAALWVTQLGWFCCASDRRVRDNATKAIINIMANSERNWPELIERFSTVDDEYVLERILAAAYGCLIRNPKESIIRETAQSIFNIFFIKGQLPKNGMVRDYARLILEFTLYKGILPSGIEPSEFRPPYNSDWPLDIPNQQFIEQYKDSYSTLPKLYRSCFGDDFNIYTIKTAIRLYNNINVPDAARWIFKHILDMGYATELHARFDEYLINKYGSGRSKPDWAERIGKKYQWIALYRLLAHLGDHAEVKEDRWEPRLHDLQARSEKNIDPTLLIRSSKKDDGVNPWWSLQKYNFSNFEQLSDQDWLQVIDFPNSRDMLLVTDPRTGKEYYVLLLYPDWSSRSPEEEYDLNSQYRHIDMHINTYLIHKKDTQKSWRWLNKKSFTGQGMPEGATIHEHLFGEYPWALPFQAYFNIYPEWQSESNAPFSIMPTSHTLLSEQEYDASKDENFSIEVPAYEFFKMESLSWDGRGCYIRENGEIAFMFPALYEPGPYALLVGKNFLDTFLDRNNLTIIWTVLAEKQCIKGFNSPGITELSCAHMLRNGDIVSSKEVSKIQLRD